jgi:hypothetical protein
MIVDGSCSERDLNALCGEPTPGLQEWSAGMDLIVVISLIVSPCITTATVVMTAHRNRRGHTSPIDPRRLALAQGALVAGVVFWLKVALTPDLRAPWAAIVAMMLALVSLLAVHDPVRAGSRLWGLAVLFPMVMLVGVSLRYLLSEGIAPGSGTVQPISEMVIVVSMASVGFFSGPAYTVGSMFGVGDARPRTRSSAADRVSAGSAPLATH